MQPCIADIESVVVPGLQGNPAESFCGEVGTKDKEFAVVISAKAWILEDRMAHVVEGLGGNGRPLVAEDSGILVAHELAERRDAYLEIGDELGVKLDKSHKLCNIADDDGNWPMV